MRWRDADARDLFEAQVTFEENEVLWITFLGYPERHTTRVVFFVCSDCQLTCKLGIEFALVLRAKHRSPFAAFAHLSEKKIISFSFWA